MTEKQEKIIQAALQLFAKEGYHATSTSKVAKAAGVSEGLIFRHFVNKEGLLQAILKVGEEKFKLILADVVMETEPKEVIRKTITMYEKIDVDDIDFWKLQLKLKWELEINSDKKMEPLKMALNNAFDKLNYEEPEMEATLLMLCVDGLGSAVLKGSTINPAEVKQFLIKKYNI